MMAEQALWWLPTAAVAALAVLGLVALAAQPQSPEARPARRYWLAAAFVCGALATAASAFQQAHNQAASAGSAARLHDLGERLDALGRLLPGGPGRSADETFDTVAAGIAALNAKVKELEARIETLREKTRTREIDPAVAEKLADYLRQAGPHRVVVSCLPEDLEAFTYANQLANVLRMAGWEALGPEKTAIFGEAPAIGIKLFVRSMATAPPETGKLLTDAFTRFNIPYQSGITPNDAIPDPATVELFVGPKP